MKFLVDAQLPITLARWRLLSVFYLVTVTPCHRGDFVLANA